MSTPLALLARRMGPILLFIPLSLWAVDWLTLQLLQDRVHAYTQRSYLGPMRAFEHWLPAQADPAALQAGLADLQRTLGEVRVSLLPLHQASVDEQATLRRGEVIYRTDAEQLLHRLPGRDWVLLVEVPAPPPIQDLLVALYGGMLLLVGLGIYAFQVRPYLRDLQGLRRTTAAIGAGELSARVPALRPGASLASLGAGINEMAARIEQGVQAQRELMHAVAHELGTPMARAQFGLSLLDGAAPPRADELRAGLREDLREMAQLVEELLGYGRLDPRGGPLALQGVHLPALVAQALAAKPLQHPLELDLDPELDRTDPPLQGEPTLLRHALVNLLANADRHASRRLSLSARRVAGTLELALEDDGPGVPPADRERIFEPFVRLDASRNRDTGGSGLGLALVARIAQRHQGRVWVEGRRDGQPGARFVLALPW